MILALPAITGYGAHKCTCLPIYLHVCTLNAMTTLDRDPGFNFQQSPISQQQHNINNKKQHRSVMCERGRVSVTVSGGDKVEGVTGTDLVVGGGLAVDVGVEFRQGKFSVGPRLLNSFVDLLLHFLVHFLEG